MAFPDVVTREEWLEARKRLLFKEKEATRERDALNAERRRLPMVAVDKEYVLEGPEGKVALADLFGDSRQLIVQHVMFGPDWDAACPGCTAGINETSDGIIAAPADPGHELRPGLARAAGEAAAVPGQVGWTIPWYSSRQRLQLRLPGDGGQGAAAAVYNYKASPTCSRTRTRPSCPVQLLPARRRPGFHTYSTWARGTDTLGAPIRSST